MAKFYQVLAITLLALTSLTYGAVCPRFATVTNLNLQEFVGTWYVNAIVASQNPQLKCMYTEFRATQFSQAPVSIDTYSQAVSTEDGLGWYDYETATVLSLATPGRWQLPFNSTVYDFSVLNTDYVDTALTVQCAVIDDQEVIRAFVASRNDQPMAQARVEYFLNILRDVHGVDTSLWHWVRQGDFECEVA